MKIQIRFNTNYFANKNSKKWRFIVDGKQHFVNSIICNEKSKTTRDIIIENDKEIEKFHITIESDKIIPYYINDDGCAYIMGLYQEKFESKSSLSWSVSNNAWRVKFDDKEYLSMDVFLLTGFYTCELDGQFFICSHPGHIWFNDNKTKILLK